jgi:GT2 family glycosyltransferase/glycosyltransferase involved in cell wall biosynthesis
MSHTISSNNTTVVCILGMHRSGTSLVTRILNICGLNLGNDEQVESNSFPENEKGHWEHIEIQNINDNILNIFGGSWDNPPDLPEHWEEDSRLGSLYEQARAVVGALNKVHEIWGFKDPRTCLTLLFWQKVIPGMKYVIPVRSPIEVAESLFNRNGILIQNGILLWFTYMVSIFRHVPNEEYIVTEFDDYFINWKEELKRIIDFVGIDIDKNNKPLFDAQIEDFISTGLRHNVCNDDFYKVKKIKKLSYEMITEWVIKAFIVSNDNIEINEGLYLKEKEIKRIQSVLDEKIIEIKHKELKLKDYDVVLSQRAAALAEVDRMQKSISWNITQPLRFAMRLFRYGLIENDKRQLKQISKTLFRRAPLPAYGKNKIRHLCNRFRNFLTKYNQKGVLFTPPSIEPCLQLAGNSDYIVWGVIGWHFRQQRPQHIAKGLADSGRRVFYVSATLVSDSRVGYDVEQLDDHGRLFQVKLYTTNSISIYESAPSVDDVCRLRLCIGAMLDWANSGRLISLVQHPFWYDVATVLPDSRIVYDCMDYHEGFGNTASENLALENALVKNADLVVVTSAVLYEIVEDQAKKCIVVRNACDFNHFSKIPSRIYQDIQDKKIIGYYGAIADWFDLDLIRFLADKFSDCTILLIGEDSVNAQSRLGNYDNVKFIGEVSYEKLPYYLYSFDVCLLPFRVTPLTMATNPVKVYEYLSAGKPVVSVDLPEMKQFEGLAQVASDWEDFAFLVSKEIHKPIDDDIVRLRCKFAKNQTWKQRVFDLIEYIESNQNQPTVSIVIITYNNLNLTKECLLSIEQNSDTKNLEIIIVDNASSDGTQGFLNQWVQGETFRKIIINDDNRGFAAANNQGMEEATGDYLVLLNNDTYVTPGWISTLVRHLDRDSTIGIIGPVTNNIGNEAKVNATYNSMDEMLGFCKKYVRMHIGKTFNIRTLAFYCVMLRRDVFEAVGPLDEAFGQGFFEDDDYCRRVEEEQLRVVCAQDVFIHHHLSASFGKLPQKKRQKLFEKNKAVYEQKWGKWVPHKYREEN